MLSDGSEKNVYEAEYFYRDLGDGSMKTIYVNSRGETKDGFVKISEDQSEIEFSYGTQPMSNKLKVDMISDSILILKEEDSQSKLVGDLLEGNQISRIKNEIKNEINNRGQIVSDFFKNYDFEKDIVAQVLNYSTFGAGGVSGHSVSAIEAMLALVTPGAYRQYIITPGRYTWRKDEKDSCVYHLAVSAERPENSSMSLAHIDLNSYSPKLIKFESQYIDFQHKSWFILVKHERDILFAVPKELIDSERLQRGWTKIYSDRCNGKKSAW